MTNDVELDQPIWFYTIFKRVFPGSAGQGLQSFNSLILRLNKFRRLKLMKNDLFLILFN